MKDYVLPEPNVPGESVGVDVPGSHKARLNAVRASPVDKRFVDSPDQAESILRVATNMGVTKGQIRLLDPKEVRHHTRINISCFPQYKKG